jgi:molecular chaperone DnaJ
VHVEEHAFFKRDGTSLVCEMPISLAAAALGASLEVPTLDGGKAKLSVPEGTQPNAAFRIRGHGVPHLGGRGRGDLHVVVRVVVPTKLNGAQRKLLEELAKTLPVPEIKEKDRSFIDKMKDILS